MAKLIFIDKNFAGRSYDLMLEKTTVGRGDHNTLVIRDKSLSSSHCEILMHGAEVIVRDLDSSNGTFVNGSRLNKQGQIKSGQSVRFGSVEARLELDPGKGDVETTEITAVYALGKVLREQRQAQKRPEPGTASMQLEPGASHETEEHTILIPRAEIPQAPAIAPQSASTEQRPESFPGRKLTLIVAVIALGAVLLLWLLKWRK